MDDDIQEDFESMIDSDDNHEDEDDNDNKLHVDDVVVDHHDKDKQNIMPIQPNNEKQFLNNNELDVFKYTESSHVNDDRNRSMDIVTMSSNAIDDDDDLSLIHI